MNYITMRTLRICFMISTITLAALGPRAQTPSQGGPPIQGNYLTDNSAEGEGELISSAGEGLSCNRQKFWVQGENIRLRFSFRESADNATGTWTTRSIFPAEANRPETIVAYYFDGRFTSGRVNLATGSFDLHGTINYSGLCNRDRSLDKQMRISGSCTGGTPMNFEVSDRDGVFAHGTFKGSVRCGIGPREVNTTLDRH